MTPQEIDAMPAGRELDALIAEMVMGINPDPEYGITLAADMNYSTDMAAAWLVVKKMGEEVREKYCITLTPWGDTTLNFLQLEQGNVNMWAATWGFPEAKDDEWYDHANDFDFSAGADTAPLAICRAALKSAMREKAVSPPT